MPIHITPQNRKAFLYFDPNLVEEDKMDKRASSDTHPPEGKGGGAKRTLIPLWYVTAPVRRCSA